MRAVGKFAVVLLGVAMALGMAAQAAERTTSLSLIKSVGDSVDCYQKKDSCEVNIEIADINFFYDGAESNFRCAVELKVPKYVRLKRYNVQGNLETVRMIWNYTGIPISRYAAFGGVKIDQNDAICMGVNAGSGLGSPVYDNSDHKIKGGKQGQVHVCHYEIKTKLRLPEIGDYSCDPVDPVVVIQD